MYDLNSVLIAGLLFASMVLAIDIGRRIGTRAKDRANKPFKAQINGVQASLLGILALLLGFTFSLALQRYDGRSVAVVDEANAIGTAFLRTQLLPSSLRGEAAEQVRRYLDLRVRAGDLTLADETRDSVLAEATRAQDDLWRLAQQAADLDGGPVSSGLFIQALNELIDAFGQRQAALDRHVPEVVLFLLYGTFLMAGSLIGYAAGVDGHHASFATYILVGLIVLLVFIIIDLDRPRRGLIEVSQAGLTTLQEGIGPPRAR